ncbi:uncharacterized protein LOC125146164 [Tachysurus ichikawai]
MRSELFSGTGAEFRSCRRSIRSYLFPLVPRGIARLQMEAQEKADKRQAELDLRLKISTLEIEAEKQVKMQQLELDAMKIIGGAAAAQSVPPPQVMPAPSAPVPSRVAMVVPPADSNSVAVYVKVGIRPSLPVKGITFILGNDLAGGEIMPMLEVTDTPKMSLAYDELSRA